MVGGAGKMMVALLASFVIVEAWTNRPEGARSGLVNVAKLFCLERLSVLSCAILWWCSQAFWAVPLFVMAKRFGHPQPVLFGRRSGASAPVFSASLSPLTWAMTILAMGWKRWR